MSENMTTESDSSDMENTSSCHICHKTYTQQCILNRHMREVHKLKVIPGGNLKCPLCQSLRVNRQTSLRLHLEEAHGIKCERRNMKFTNYAAFLRWKVNEQRETLNTFTMKTSAKVVSGRAERFYYHCHRSGHHRSKSTGERRPSNRIESTCPSMMIVTREVNGETKVNYWKTHVGHVGVARRERARVQDLNEGLIRFSRAANLVPQVETEEGKEGETEEGEEGEMEEGEEEEMEEGEEGEIEEGKEGETEEGEEGEMEEDEEEATGEEATGESWSAEHIMLAVREEERRSNEDGENVGEEDEATLGETRRFVVLREEIGDSVRLTVTAVDDEAAARLSLSAYNSGLRRPNESTEELIVGVAENLLERSRLARSVDRYAALEAMRLMGDAAAILSDYTTSN